MDKVSKLFYASCANVGAFVLGCGAGFALLGLSGKLHINAGQEEDEEERKTIFALRVTKKA